MDAGIDLIAPEFLNIIFFEQKNLIIYPYIDLKHLHALELFTVGFNVIDLESTALYNLKDIIQTEANNSYSQNKTFFFVYNLSGVKIKEIMEIENIRCILNSSENLSNLKLRQNFVAFNKKTKQFFNYNEKSNKLDFEKYLISSSENYTILQDRIQKIKMDATKLFMELNNNPESTANIPKVLKDYNPKFWHKILKFVELYFNVKLPDLDLRNKDQINFQSKKNEGQNQIKKYAEEYTQILTRNKIIAKEFIQSLHEYRCNHVNPRNLELEQLYDPQKLYIYLRTHHWSKEIPKNFLLDWIQMKNSGYKLNQEELNDFITIIKDLGLKNDEIIGKLEDSMNNISGANHKEVKKAKVCNKDEKTINESINIIPSIKNFQLFKAHILSLLNDIELLIDNLNKD
ncbi:MAG: hypothetical protein EU541_05030 [Promethearchaeota archaeon]|nr:MAG: hypothetical protein EU541_05030 [Candidatus Lokiarchaeota archaeon]